ncbi:hypothetical protein FHS39_000271 [Streptomyces olivoverticillatus]|uniref:ATP-binding protein n=1 Tax=Streptomyces olivoverticillatus TaxID=66427 RepID=A0A7W7LKG8_9ACTN|nr:ATP-binding protein [Streptomyces olivoverticillatus]MBB4891271.1 hypothetical protein [Streptomyces olivoverticillatus]
MDPTNRESGENHNDEQAPAPADGGEKRRPPRQAPVPEAGGQGPVRVVQLVSGDYLLTVNPVDGSEIEPCPPGKLPARARRRDADGREALRRAAAPPPPARPAGPDIPLVGRQEERERLARLLSRGRSVRLTGPAGSGRSALLDAVAEDCAELAPDGVVRLGGRHRTAADLLQELFATVYDAPLHRPDRAALLAAVQEIGAVVVVDDLEFGGSALDELLDATPECAFLLAATPDVAAPSADSHLEEVFLNGLDRTGCLELLERAVDRALTDEEADWAADLWFESEGLPLRFVQAGALLRHRDAGSADPADVEEFGVFAERPYAEGSDGPAEAAPLPTLAQAAAPAALLVSRLSKAARETLRFALALGGELPHQAHLPALAGDTHADAAIGDLLACGLISTVGAHYRLAAGVADQLLAEGYGTDAVSLALSAAQHYAWWAGHPSVTPERIAVEADTILAAMGALVSDGEAGHRAAALLLARTAAPAFAAALHWGAWERSLRCGQEAARRAGEVGEEAYFHHELGVLALCSGNLDRARAELEASIGLRGVLADKRGAVAGRRALALVADRSGLAMGARPAPAPGPGGVPRPVPPLPPMRGTVGSQTPAGEEIPAARSEESAAPPAKPVPRPVPRPVPAAPAEVTTAIINRVPAPKAPPHTPAAPRSWTQKLMAGGNRRNLAAAGAGAVLAAVLAAVVTLGSASGGSDNKHSDTVKPGQSASEQDGDKGLSADEPAAGESGAPQVPGKPRKPGQSPGAGGAPSSPGATGSASPSAPGSSGPATQSPTPTGGPTHGPTHSPTSDPTGNPTSSGPTSGPTGSPTKPTEPTITPPTQPTAGGSSNSASGPAPGGTPSRGSGSGSTGSGTPVA